MLQKGRPLDFFGENQIKRKPYITFLVYACKSRGETKRPPLGFFGTMPLFSENNVFKVRI